MSRAIKILGEPIPLTDDYIAIEQLKFLKDNPRVYACTHSVDGFEEMIEEEQQLVIYQKLLQESSVKNLIPDIKRHGGLLESILVRNDTGEVIEGNSRLAVYRKLFEEKNEDGDWELIPCDIVGSLTDEQLAAYLNEVHVKGKTQWPAYEKANFAHVHWREKGWTLDKIAKMFGESVATIRIRIKIIELMKENNDGERSRFSYYDVIVRKSEITDALKQNSELKEHLLSKIKEIKVTKEEQGHGRRILENEFTAQQLRDYLPVVIKKPKVLKKFISDDVDLIEAHQRANISRIEVNLRDASNRISGIEKTDVNKLERNRFNAFHQDVKKLSRVVDRIKKICIEIKDRNKS